MVKISEGYAATISLTLILNILELQLQGNLKKGSWWEGMQINKYKLIGHLLMIEGALWKRSHGMHCKFCTFTPDV